MDCYNKNAASPNSQAATSMPAIIQCSGYQRRQSDAAGSTAGRLGGSSSRNTSIRTWRSSRGVRAFPRKSTNRRLAIIYHDRRQGRASTSSALSAAFRPIYQHWGGWRFRLFITVLAFIIALAALGRRTPARRNWMRHEIAYALIMLIALAFTLSVWATVRYQRYTARARRGYRGKAPRKPFWMR